MELKVMEGHILIKIILKQALMKLMFILQEMKEIFMAFN